MIPKSPKQGLTILEVVVSMAIVAVAMIPLLNGLLNVAPEARVIQQRYAMELLRAELLRSDNEFASFSRDFEHQDLRGVMWYGKIEWEETNNFLCKRGQAYLTTDTLNLEYCIGENRSMNDEARF